MNAVIVLIHGSNVAACAKKTINADSGNSNLFKVKFLIANFIFIGKNFVNKSKNDPKMFFFLNLLHRSKNVPNVQKKLHM